MTSRSSNKQEIEKKIKEGFVGQKMFVLPRNILEEVKKRPLIKTLYVTDIGYFPNAKHHYWERKNGCKSYLLLYCISGKGFIEMPGRSVTLYSNMYYIIPAMTPHKYMADKKDPWTIYWLHFWGNNSHIIYEKYAENSENKGVPVYFDERRVSLLNNLLDVLKLGYSINNLDYINISIWQLLISFIYSDFYIKIGKPDRGSDFVNSVINYVLDNLDKNIVVKELAEKFNYSNSHFLTLFKKKTGFTPVQYFNHLKVQKACMYLIFTDMNIKEIAYGLGYNDPMYFSRLFKKIIGESPNTYRMKNPK